MKVTLTNYTINPVEAIEQAAANCYNTKPSADGHIMKACYDSGHHSVLEFAKFTWHIEGVSRSLLAQLTRHRLSSFAVRSQRYCSESGFSSVIPPSIQTNEEALMKYQDALQTIKIAYNFMVSDCEIPAEDARYILPNACETTLECTMNLREFMHFCNERLCSKAQWEIRNLAQAMRDEVIAVMPEAEQYLVPKCEVHSPYCFCTEKKSCGRHPKLSEVYADTRAETVH